MGMDIRLPMGVMFVILGGILVGVGLVRSGGADLDQTLGINLNLWWGVLILLFGAVMLALALVGRRKAPPGHEGTI